MSHPTTPPTQKSSHQERQRLSRLEIASAYPTPSNRLLTTQTQETPSIPLATPRRLTRSNPQTTTTAPEPSLRERYQRAEESPMIRIPGAEESPILKIPGATEGNNSLNSLYQYQNQYHSTPPPTTRNKTPKPTPFPTTAQKFIDLLPTIPISALPVENRECNICITPFHTGIEPESAVKLPCTHIFGLGCITRWLEEGVEFKRQCPMCRSVLFVEDQGREERGVEVGGEVEVEVEVEVDVGRLALLRARYRMDRMLSQRAKLERARGVGGRRRRGY